MALARRRAEWIPRQTEVLSTGASEDMIRLSAEYDVGLALGTTRQPNRDLCLTNKIFSYLLAGNAVAATSTTAQKAIVETLGSGRLSLPVRRLRSACPWSTRVAR